jgi:hypothetical protein
MAMKYAAKIIASATILLAPASSALACPACFASSSPKTLTAFYISTLLLTAMPFALIGGFVMFLRRRSLGAPQPPAVSAD